MWGQSDHTLDPHTESFIRLSEKTACLCSESLLISNKIICLVLEENRGCKQERAIEKEATLLDKKDIMC